MDEMNKTNSDALQELAAELETSGMSRRERRERAMRLAAEEAARKAEQEGVTLTVEPFTKYTTHICNEASQLRRLLRTVNSPRLMGLADTDVIATTAVDTFSTFLDVIGPENLGHVHFVDGNPGGHLVPGDGVLDLDGALEKLKAIHYTGALGLEVLDRRYVFAPEAAMKQAMDWYKERI